jgi:hypothetical protein
MLNPRDRAQIELICSDLIAKYVTGIDEKDWATVGSVFAAHAIFTRTNMEPLVGLENIAHYFAGVEAERRARGANHETRHLITTSAIRCIDARHAEGVSYVLLFRDPDHHDGVVSALRNPEILIEYLDHFEFVDGTWRISSHQADHVLRSADFLEPPRVAL